MSSRPAREAAAPAPDDGGNFSIGRGAPFLRLQEALRLVEHGSLSATRRAIFFAVACWLPPFLLAALHGDLFSPPDGRAFLRDFTVPARFLVAVPLLLLIEPIADARLARLVREFGNGGLVPEGRARDFREAVVDAHRARDSAPVEVALAALGHGGSGVPLRRVPEVAQQAAEGIRPHPVHLRVDARLDHRGEARREQPDRPDAAVHAGHEVQASDGPRAGARWLPLPATHPDRCGGLAFIGQFPSAFAGFAFATTTVVAAALARRLVWGGGRIEDLQWAVAGWTLLVLGLFVLPLAVFLRPLREAKERALLEFAALSLRHDHAFERRWIRGGAPAEDLLGSSDTSSLADLASGYRAAKAMRAIPLVAEGLVPVAIAVAVPLACAVATQVPVRTMLRALRDFVL